MAVIGGLHKQAIQPSTLPGCLIVECTAKSQDTDGPGPKTTSEILTGLGAAAAMAWLKQKSTNVPEESAMGTWLSHILPSHVRPTAKKQSLVMILELAKIGRRFENSGLNYAIEAGSVASTSLSGEAMQALLENRIDLSSTLDAAIASGASSLSRLAVVSSVTDSQDFRSQYRSFIGILHVRYDGPKRFTLTNVEVQPGAFTHRL
ncbi:MAG: hypothetical protein HOP23_01235 [Methylococcaceae bacterium]|nr:hypothetical protein [Methylococcaceae bacterium]